MDTFSHFPEYTSIEVSLPQKYETKFTYQLASTSIVFRVIFSENSERWTVARILLS